jgi:chromosome segregation ATPase
VDDLRLLGEQKCVLANSLQKAEGKASAANERVQELESQLGQVGDELKALQAEHDLARKYALTLARIWAMDSADLRSVEGDSLLHLLVGLGGKYSQFVSGLTLRIESLENNEKDSKPATSHRVGGFPCI